MPTPLDRPLHSEKNRKFSEPVAPTAARASGPMNRPTIIMSTMLYTCWNRLPASSGSMNRSSSPAGLPRVMSIE